MEKPSINRDQSIVANHQAPEISKPCEGAFYFPSAPIPAQFSPILQLGVDTVFPMRTDQIDIPGLQSFSQRTAIVAFIGDQPLYSVFTPAASFARHLNLLKRTFDKGYFRRRGRSKCASQRNTFAVDHHHPLRTFTSFGFPDAGAPFFAGAKLPSAKVSSQSKYCFSSSSASRVRQISSHMPISSHNLSLRQQVEGLGYMSGKSRQRAPVFRTHKMPSRTLRLSFQGGPPFFPGAVEGKSGSIFFHCSSFNKGVVRAIVSPPTAYYPKTLKKSSDLTG